MGGKRLRDGRFIGDKYSIRRFNGQNVSADKLVLSFHDPDARSALLLFANTTKDDNLARDIKARLRSIAEENRDQAPGAARPGCGFSNRY